MADDATTPIVQPELPYMPDPEDQPIFQEPAAEAAAPVPEPAASLGEVPSPAPGESQASPAAPDQFALRERELQQRESQLKQQQEQMQQWQREQQLAQQRQQVEQAIANRRTQLETAGYQQHQIDELIEYERTQQQNVIKAREDASLTRDFYMGQHLAAKHYSQIYGIPYEQISAMTTPEQMDAAGRSYKETQSLHKRIAELESLTNTALKQQVPAGSTYEGPPAGVSELSGEALEVFLPGGVIDSDRVEQIRNIMVNDFWGGTSGAQYQYVLRNTNRTERPASIMQYFSKRTQDRYAASKAARQAYLRDNADLFPSPTR